MECGEFRITLQGEEYTVLFLTFIGFLIFYAITFNDIRGTAASSKGRNLGTSRIILKKQH